MREYLLRRLLLLIPTLLGVTLIVFLMMRFIPGDPITNMMGETYSASARPSALTSSACLLISSTG